MTLRDQILSKKIPLREEKYYWKAMDCEVLLQELTRSQVDELQDSMIDQRTKKIITAKYAAAKIIMSVHDPETGQPVFTKTDAKTISSWPASVTDELSKKIEDLNGARMDDADEAVKN
jgi:spore germination cell wall hydrolase CwlJ-like protein